MKKNLLSLVAIMLATVARAADGDTFTFEGLKYKVISETYHTVMVSDNRRASGEINIPYFVTGKGSRYEVRRIENLAFKGCSSLTSVTIPGSVVAIENRAFEGCSSLTSVTIPGSVVTIYNGAFSNCASLNEINVDSDNEYFCSSNGILYNHEKTRLIQCPGAKTVVDIPNSVTEIGEYAFYCCSSLTSVTIPNSLTKINDGTFAGCSSLISVTIPNSVTEIGDNAFNSCSSLISVDIPNSVTKIGDYVFAGCSSLISVDIPNSVTKIGSFAFAGCSSLTSVILPNSMTTIYDRTFKNCSSLTSVTIPKSVTKILDWAFLGCKNLTEIIDLNPTPQTAYVETFEDVSANVVIFIPKGSYRAYMLADGWTKFSNFREMAGVDIILSESTLELYMGETAEVSVTVLVNDEVTDREGEWASSNPEVATVEDGKVTAVAPGTAEITYTVYDNFGGAHSGSCTVRVKEPIFVDYIYLDPDFIAAEEGNEVQLTVFVFPDVATNKEIAWSSSDEAVATVSATGLVKILKAGTCVITAATTDGSGLKAECTIIALSGIDDILNDNPAMADVYTTQGVAVLRNASATEISTLPAGLYIIRQGNTVKKIAVK